MVVTAKESAVPATLQLEFKFKYDALVCALSGTVALLLLPGSPGHLPKEIIYVYAYNMQRLYPDSICALGLRDQEQHTVLVHLGPEGGQGQTASEYQSVESKILQ